MSAAEDRGLTDGPVDLTEKLKQRIARMGPLSVADFMEAALLDDEFGYYRTADPLGAGGDFITAPEVSQVFGELIGLWCVEVWSAMGAPNPFNLVELGPGRGTLMADALRAARLVPNFIEAAKVQLVEVSPGLRKQQKAALQGCGAPIQWRKSLEHVPRGPALIIANEFVDALPIRQLVRKGKGWYERCVTANAKGTLAFSVAKCQAADGQAISSIFGSTAKPGEIVETRPLADELIAGFGKRAARDPVAALIVDYGHAASAPGDTLQAVRRHDHVSPLKAPGSADLTAHVDFAQLAATASAGGLAVWGPVTQRMFLLTLGLAERCQALLEGASRQEAELIVSGAGRLVNSDQMGHLFKVLALASPGLPAPPALAKAIEVPA